MTFNPQRLPGGLIRSVVEFTRPGNITAYSALASVSSSTSAPVPLLFSDVVPQKGGSGVIVGVRHVKGGTTVPQFRLVLFNAAITPPNDGTVFPMLLARAASRVAAIDLSHATSAAGSDCSEGAAQERSIPFQCGDGLTSLWGVLLSVAGHTPSSGSTNRIELLTLPLS